MSGAEASGAWRIEKKIPVAQLVAGTVGLLIQVIILTWLFTKMDFRIARLEEEKRIDTARRDLAIQQGVQLQQLIETVRRVDDKIDDLAHAKSFDRIRKGK